jgi:hypothetical protein
MHGMKSGASTAFSAFQLRVDATKIKPTPACFQGDETIIEYICGVLEDEHFEFGDDGEEAFEAIGPFLVS